ncbi:hypothetical protein Q7P37_010306 [Cladosporium fusiforme]
MSLCRWTFESPRSRIAESFGAYYRRRLFTAKGRSMDRGNCYLSRCILSPSKHDSRVQVVEFLDQETSRKSVSDRKLFVYVHGSGRSASATIRTSDGGDPDIIRKLLRFGQVMGVNLPGYEQSPLTGGNLKNAEQDTIKAAGELAEFLRAEVRSKCIDVEDIIIVGVSIGTYLSLCLATILERASVVLIVPPSDLRTVPFSVCGIPLGPLIPWAAKHAYPTGKRVTTEYVTTGFDSVAMIEEHGARISGTCAIFTARYDRVVPSNAGKRLTDALESTAKGTGGRSGLTRLKLMENEGHEARPLMEEWEDLFEEWGFSMVDAGKAALG